MNTKHNDTCKMAFGRPSKHDQCPRCEELKNGAAPRHWNYTRRNIVQPVDKYVNGHKLYRGVYCMSLDLSKNKCPTCGGIPYTD